MALDETGTERFAALKAWRAEVAREHNLPAYVVFHDATLAEMARERPATLDELAGISGVGAKKLERYGAEILRVLSLARIALRPAAPPDDGVRHDPHRYDGRLPLAPR